ncbi:MAG: lipocalin family protein [Dehalococcoidia bacterium]|nr:lipocalin family protein [Dehalococcoidia bacterium]
MRQGAVVATVVMVLILLVPTLLGCGDGSPYGPAQVHLPEDEGAHPESTVEWWYLNATVSDEEGHQYTAMLAYFHPTLKIISTADLDARLFYHEVPTISELLAATPDFAEGKLDLRWDDSDRWYRTSDDVYEYSLQARGDTIGFAFNLVQEKKPLMVGGDGLIEWTEGSTYYYSLTRLQVEGQIEIEGQTIAVEGIGWMDHQWMDDIAEKGWQWFSIQLDDDTDIICWNIVSLDGTIESSDLTMMLADGSIYHTTNIELKAADSWRSPETGQAYGTAWTLREPKRDLNLQVAARFPQQEIILFKGTPYTWHFWEGGTTVSGKIGGETASGTGYAELVPRILVAG